MEARTEEERRGGPSPTDPLIDEVRAWRRTLWQRFDDDPDKVYAHLRELEKTHAYRVVRVGTEDSPPKAK